MSIGFSLKMDMTMIKIKRKLQFIVCKILGIQYRHILSEWELRNLVTRDPRIYLGIGRDGVSSIVNGRTDSPQDHSASNSLIYYIGREIFSFHQDIEARLRKLDGIEPFTISPPQLTALDQLLKDTEDENEKPLSLLEEFEQEQNEKEEVGRHEHS